MNKQAFLHVEYFFKICTKIKQHVKEMHMKVHTHTHRHRHTHTHTHIIQQILLNIFLATEKY